MKTLTNNTLVLAVAMTLWATASMAGEVSNLPTSSSEKDTISATAAASPATVYALSRLDTSTLAEQEMTDQELKAVEGGRTLVDLQSGAVYTGIYGAFMMGFYCGNGSTPGAC